MWQCEDCAEWIDDQFDAYWNCCEAQGTTESHLLDDTERLSITDAPQEETERRWQFNLKTLWLLTTFAAILAAILRLHPTTFLFAFGAIAVANLLGISIGLFVTHVLGFPTDGSLRGEPKLGDSTSDDLH